MKLLVIIFATFAAMNMCACLVLAYAFVLFDVRLASDLSGAIFLTGFIGVVSTAAATFINLLRRDFEITEEQYEQLHERLISKDNGRRIDSASKGEAAELSERG